MNVDKININLIVQEVMKKLSEPQSNPSVVPQSNPSAIAAEKEAVNAKTVINCKMPDKSEDGVFENIEDAIESAVEAQKKLVGMCLGRRKIIIEAMRAAILNHVDTIAEMAVRETGLGKIKDKVSKNILAAQKTPGVEDIEPKAYTGDHGFTLVEQAPYGVIGAITPSTNPSETVVCNGIGMIAAGNAVVFNSHPGAKMVTKYTVQLLNRAIVQAGGPANLLCVISEPTMETGKLLMTHAKIRLLVVTGGPEIVKLAMHSGKKVIAAGPGNPPVVVDETANLEKAAAYIIDGAALDNNVLCIAEKEVFVVDCVAEQLIQNMITNGAYELSKSQLEALMPVISLKNCRDELIPNKKFIGKDVRFILETIGVEVPTSAKIAIAQVSKNHPLVYMEQLMPILPIVRVRDVDEAIQEAYKAEQNHYHTAVMHSTNVEHLGKMARTMNTSIFVKNAPSYAGLGLMGEGFATFTIASPTGEGLTSAVSFTRQRRCVLKDQFRII